MNLQSAVKLLLASSLAACCALPANAQIVDTEITATISSLHGGGWAQGIIGQPVALDFSYDAGNISNSLSNGFLIASAPITSASIVSGVFGSGINLEPDGTGTIADKIDLNTGTVTASVVTSAHAPVHGFTGTVFGMSFITDGVNTTFDLVRNVFFNGIRDARDSGTAFLSNVNTVSGGQAPEIDPASALSALTLLLGGLAVIRGKKFAKVPAA